MRKQTHPDTEQLDRLRAGLLDAEPERKNALESHVAACADCQSRLGNWHQLGALTLEIQPGLKPDLMHARRQALAAAPKHHLRRFAPLATAAALLIALSAGLWTLQYGTPTVQHMTARTSVDVPDIYEDIDFYLWLATQKEQGATDEHNNANST